MSKIFRLSKAGARLMYKIRHHKGHGIHSPFVFSFITKVIEERSEYHVYGDMQQFLETKQLAYSQETKSHRLLFKIVNYFNLKKVLVLGEGVGLNSLYLTLAASDIECECVSQSKDNRKKASLLYQGWGRNIVQLEEEFPTFEEKKDCVFVDLREYEVLHEQLIDYLLSSVHENSVVIVDGIRTNRKSQMLWKQLVCRHEVIISLDLFHFGILFFNKKYFKQNYKLSF